MAAHVAELRAQGDFGVALIVAQRALNTLEDLYCFNKMQHRRPSPADRTLVDRFEETLEFTLLTGHVRSCRRVAGAAHVNLRRCAEAAADAGLTHHPSL